MKAKTFKDGLLILVATLIALILCTITSATVYTFLTLTGLYEIGESLIFRVGLSLINVGMTGLVIEELVTKWVHPDIYAEEHAFDDI